MLFYNNFRSKRPSTNIYLNLFSSFNADMWQFTFKDLINFFETPYMFMQPQRCYVDAGFYTETKCVVHPIFFCQCLIWHPNVIFVIMCTTRGGDIVRNLNSRMPCCLLLKVCLIDQELTIYRYSRILYST